MTTNRLSKLSGVVELRTLGTSGYYAFCPNNLTNISYKVTDIDQIFFDLKDGQKIWAWCEENCDFCRVTNSVTVSP